VFGVLKYPDSALTTAVATAQRSVRRLCRKDTDLKELSLQKQNGVCSVVERFDFGKNSPQTFSPGRADQGVQAESFQRHFHFEPVQVFLFTF